MEAKKDVNRGRRTAPARRQKAYQCMSTDKPFGATGSI